MTILKALVTSDLTRLVRSGNLHKIPLTFLVLVTSGYFLRFASLQNLFTAHGPQLVGKSMFHDLSVLQVVLLIFFLLWGYPQFPKPAGIKLIFGLPLSSLNPLRVLLAQNISSMILAGLLTMLTLPFLIVVYMLGGVDVEGIIRAFLFYLVLGLTIMSLRKFWHHLTGFEIRASAFSFLTLLVLATMHIYFYFFYPLSSTDAVVLIVRMLSPLPDFLESSRSLMAWSSIIGKLALSLILQGLTLIRKGCY